MTKVEVFEITYNNDQAVYKEGDSVSGIVKLELTDDIKTKGKTIKIMISISFDECSIGKFGAHVFL